MEQQIYINLNGTSPEELLTLRYKALTALIDANTTLALMSPHPRDYLTKENYSRAERIHNTRKDSVRALIFQIQEEIVEIERQSS